ncbi:MAG: hypothetical protein IJP56_08420, partial [Synergistaceae bacterium]|nr:hypothetical protein [Synergistaceae bacterium]
MLYILIGLFFAAAFGALIKARHKSDANNSNAENANNNPAVNSLGVPVPGVAALEPDLDPALSAKPISSPDTVASATYSSAAPPTVG